MTLYGKNKITGRDLCQNIVNILKCGTNTEALIKYSIERLYKQRCLLQSIFEAEPHNVNSRYAYERNYHDSMGLYLSIRGSKILELLENDSILFEIFRDDIDTNLLGNKTPSANMTQKDKLIYLIKYCGQLFEIEKTYIQTADKVEYFRAFNGNFIISRLIRGIRNSIHYFYKKSDDDYYAVKNELGELLNNMNRYKAALLENDDSLQINLV